MELFPRSLPVRAVTGRTEAGRAWWRRLPSLVEDLREQWSLRLEAPYTGGSCSWAAPARLPDGTPAVLKVAWPHREATGEAEALRLWNGQAAARLFAHDPARHALLLERVAPGDAMNAAADVDVEQRLTAGALVLRELWQVPLPATTALERLGDVTAEWADLVEDRARRLSFGYDPGLVAHGARLLRELPGTAVRVVLLHGDANPGNLLAAGRRPWLAIDPKPMIGDRAYDPWPLLEQLGLPERGFTGAAARGPARGRLESLADAVGEEPRRLAAWGVARSVETAMWRADHGGVTAARTHLRKARDLAELAQL